MITTFTRRLSALPSVPLRFIGVPQPDLAHHRTSFPLQRSRLFAYYLVQPATYCRQGQAISEAADGSDDLLKLLEQP